MGRRRQPDFVEQLPASRRGRRVPRTRLLTRDSLDGRTRAAAAFDAIAEGIANDLGGSDQLTTIQKHLCEAFAGIAISMQDLNTRLLLGEPINVVEQAHCISTMVRVAARIGVDRVARDLGPTLSDYLRPAPP